MQLTETSKNGLQREYRVVVPAAALSQRADQRLDSMKDRVKIPGFRPGKVPVSHLKKMYGRSVMGEVLNETVGDAIRTLGTEHKLKLAGEPQVEFSSDEKEVEAVVSGEADLSFTMKVEVLPKIEIGDFKSVKLTKDVTEVTDKDIQDALKRIAERSASYTPKGKGAKAVNGDRLTIDYAGSIDGVPFDGGTAESAYLVLGSGQFIPGFEDQLVGTGADEERTLKVTFPQNYPAAQLAGKEASFKVRVKEIAVAGESKIDDEFARSLGLENLAKLKDAVREQLAREDAAASRHKLKRRLLDALDERYSFELPPSLVEQEYTIIWSNITAEMEQKKLTFADEGTTEEEAKKEYRAIAERRVRLGLLLAEVGEQNKIEVSKDEMNRALADRMRQFPGQEKQVYEYYQKNPQALAELRAPVYEEKLVDFILELANVDENKVSREELFRPDEDSGSKAGKAKPKPGKARGKKA